MRSVIFTGLVLGIISFASPAAAQDISGGVELKTSYTLGDYLYVGGADPVVQAYADVAIGDSGCSANVWGNLSLGEQVGNELDLGASCEFNLAEDTSVSITATRYLLFDQGVPDMTAVTTKVTHGPVDATVGVYLWDNLPDGLAANVGYTAEVEQFTLRGSIHYATGLGDGDIVFAGLSASYPLTDHLSLSVQGYLPLIKSAGDTREERLVGALSWSF